MGRAILLFFLLVAAVIVAGIVTGFWSDIRPALIDEVGPGHLSTDFGVGLVTEFTSFVVQVIVTIVIFQFVAGARKRKNEKRAQLDIGEKLADVYLDFLQNEPNVHWQNLSQTSTKREVPKNKLYELLIENSEGLDKNGKYHLLQARDEFDALFFPHPEVVRDPTFVQNKASEFLVELRKALQALGFRNPLFGKNQERQQKTNVIARSNSS